MSSEWVGEETRGLGTVVGRGVGEVDPPTVPLVCIVQGSVWELKTEWFTGTCLEGLLRVR